jgi:Zn-finger nucleic acid-binding protein
MRCPECSGALLSADAAGVEIDCCPRCSALWLDTGELRRIDPAAAPWTRAVASRTASATGACPRCPEIALWSHPVGPDLPLRVAECRRCGGLWLAASDLAAVKRHVESRASAPPPRRSHEAERPVRRRRSYGAWDVGFLDFSDALEFFSFLP